MESDKISFLKTNDGSYTIYLKDLDETYHSINGAFSESLHVYIINGLNLIKEQQNEINILEVGFGTGLNTLLTLDHALPNQNINYLSLEPYPLDLNTIEHFYQDFHQKPKHLGVINQLVNSKMNEWIEIKEGFNFCMLNGLLQNLCLENYSKFNQNKIDIVYYDAFAPAKQSEMWEIDTLKCAVDLLKPGGFLTTYCAQGQFKRNLKALGLKVESARGPVGKREMTIAYKL